MFDLARLESERNLSLALNAPIDLLQAWQDDRWKAGVLRGLDVPRRAGPPRRVWAVSDASFRTALKNLALAAHAAYGRPAHVHGYVKGESIVKNAGAHLGKRKVLVADISSFFKSISSADLADAWSRLGVGAPQAANALAAICSFNGSLPEGFHTSPILSNAACTYLDEDLAILAKQYGCHLSRYADDVTLSGDEVPTEHELSSLLSRRGFSLKPRSYRVMMHGKTQIVCGVSVAFAGGARAPREVKHRLRQELYYIERFGLRDVAARRGVSADRLFREVSGLFGWVRSIEGSFRCAGLDRLFADHGSM